MEHAGYPIRQTRIKPSRRIGWPPRRAQKFVELLRPTGPRLPKVQAAAHQRLRGAAWADAECLWMLTYANPLAPNREAHDPLWLKLQRLLGFRHRCRSGLDQQGQLCASMHLPTERGNPMKLQMERPAKPINRSGRTAANRPAREDDALLASNAAAEATACPIAHAADCTACTVLVLWVSEEALVMQNTSAVSKDKV